MDLGCCQYHTVLLALSPVYSAEGSARLPGEIPRPAKSKATCAYGVGSGSWVTFSGHPQQTWNHDADKKDASFHFRYLMDNVAHEILIGHAGQLQVYGNVRGDIGDGGHSLQGDKKVKSPTLNHTAIKILHQGERAHKRLVQGWGRAPSGSRGNEPEREGKPGVAPVGSDEKAASWITHRKCCLGMQGSVLTLITLVLGIEKA